ncbi:MAG: hypothetical protein WBN94_12150 [Methanothrix sp.]
MTDEESQKTLTEEERTVCDKEYKFLKPGKGTGPKEGAHVAVFPKRTTGAEIVNAMIAAMQEEVDKAKAETAKKKKEVNDLK